MSKRATKGEIIRRVGEIASLIVRGESRERIVRFSSGKYDIKERMTEKYIAKAKVVIEQSVEKNVSYDYSKAILRYEQLYKLSFDKKDFKTCLSINKELTTLQGLFKQQIEHSGKIKFICNVPD